MKMFIGLMLIINAFGFLLLFLWPEKPAEPPEMMTLLIWGPPNSDAGTIVWLYGKANQEEALRWKVWQVPGFELKHRFVIKGRPIDD